MLTLSTGAVVDVTRSAAHRGVTRRLKDAGELMDARFANMRTAFSTIPAERTNPGLILLSLVQARKPDPLGELAQIRSGVDAAQADASLLLASADVHLALLVACAKHILEGGDIAGEEAADPMMVQTAREVRTALVNGLADRQVRALAETMLEDARFAARKLGETADALRRNRAALKLGFLRGAASALERLAKSAEEPGSMGSDQVAGLKALAQRTRAQAIDYGRAYSATFAHDDIERRRVPALRCVRALASIGSAAS